MSTSKSHAAVDAAGAPPNPPAPALAHVGLGANLGDPTQALIHACQALARLGRIHAVSRLYATTPVGGPADQPRFRNAVVVWEPAPAYQSPTRALDALLAVERALGRNRYAPDAVRWGPRRIDLDLLAWEGNPAPPRLRRAAAPSLGGRAPTLPHPRAFTRPFVLIPWADAAPAFRPAEAGSRASPAAGDSIAERAAACTPEGVQAAPSQETRVWERVTGALCRPR